MLKETGRDHGSEAHDISHLVEGVEDKYTDPVEKNVENTTYQEEEGVNDAVLTFNLEFPEIDIANKEQMLKIQDHIMQAYEKNPKFGSELRKLLDAEVTKQLPNVQNKEQQDFVNEIAKSLEGMTIEDIDKGMAKGHSE